uniref:Uncharacterized protein n=1 Tax=Pseudoalteromonas citrea DSM 8771 TaxID=1117314 RepID=U1JS38_9GAMM
MWESLCLYALKEFGEILNKFDYRFDAAPNQKAKVIRYIVYTLLVCIASFSFMYFIHYMGDVLNINVNQPIREFPTNVVILGLLGMLVAFTLIYTVLLILARVIFTKLRV